MDKVVHETPQRVKLRVCASDGHIVFDWSSFSIKLNDIVVLHEKALAAAVHEHAPYFIADTSKVRDVLPQDVIQAIQLSSRSLHPTTRTLPESACRSWLIQPTI